MISKKIISILFVFFSTISVSYCSKKDLGFSDDYDNFIEFFGRSMDHGFMGYRIKNKGIDQALYVYDEEHIIGNPGYEYNGFRLFTNDINSIEIACFYLSSSDYDEIIKLNVNIPYDWFAYPVGINSVFYSYFHNHLYYDEVNNSITFDYSKMKQFYVAKANSLDGIQFECNGFKLAAVIEFWNSSDSLGNYVTNFRHIPGIVTDNVFIPSLDVAIPNQYISYQNINKETLLSKMYAFHSNQYNDYWNADIYELEDGVKAIKSKCSIYSDEDYFKDFYKDAYLFRKEEYCYSLKYDYKNSNAYLEKEKAYFDYYDANIFMKTIEDAEKKSNGVHYISVGF